MKITTGLFAPIILALVLICLPAKANLKLAHTLEHGAPVRAVAFSPDGKIVAGSTDEWEGGRRLGQVRLWDTQTGKLLRVLREPGRIIHAITFSPDGQTLASGGDYGIRFWNVANGTEKKLIREYPEVVVDIAYSPDGSTLAAGMWSSTTDNVITGGVVKLWDIATSQLKWQSRLTGQEVNSIAYSPDGSTLAAGSASPAGRPTTGAIRLWNVTSGNLKHTLRNTSSGINSVAFSPDGSTLAGGGGFEVKLWDLRTNQWKRTLRGHNYRVNSVAFSPGRPDGTGRTLASGSGGIPEDHNPRNELILWDATSGKVAEKQTGEGREIYAVAFAPRGKMLATAAGDPFRGTGRIRLWRY